MTNNENQVLLDKFLSKLPQYKKKELRNLYVNAVKTNHFDEEQFEILAQAIEEEMRDRFPTEAKKIFGGLDTKHRNFLKVLLQSVKINFDIHANKHKNKVKCGAGVFKGDKLIDLYISFKLSKEAWCGVYIQQVNSQSPAILTMRENSGEQFNKKSYDFDTQVEESEILSCIHKSMKEIGFKKSE